jgi:hypothetical protein
MSVDQELSQHFRAAYDADGVDRSLIRANLDRTPTERLEALEEWLQALTQVRRLQSAPLAAPSEQK